MPLNDEEVVVSNAVSLAVVLNVGCVSDAGGLSVDVTGFQYDQAGTRGKFAGAVGSVVVDDQTNYVYLDSVGALIINTTGFPAGSIAHIRLAIVTTQGGVVVNIEDQRAILTSALVGGGGGESNTGANVGAGVGVFRDKTGVVLNLRSLIAGTNVTIVNNGDDITISAAGGGGVPDMRDVVVFDHFQSGNDDTDEMGLMGWREFGTGTGSSIDFSPAIAGHPGILQVNAGTGATARRAIGLGDSSGTGGRIVVGGTNPLVYETLVRFPTAADFDAANLMDVQFGLGLNWGADTELADGVYFRYTPGTDTEWSLVTADGGVRTVLASGTAPVAGNWVRLGFSATAAGVQGILNGVNFGAPIATNIPAGGLGIGFKARSANGAGAALQADYVQLTQVTDKET